MDEFVQNPGKQEEPIEENVLDNENTKQITDKSYGYEFDQKEFKTENINQNEDFDPYISVSSDMLIGAAGVIVFLNANDRYIKTVGALAVFYALSKKFNN